MPIIQALDRALKIVELFDEVTTELKITEISAKLGAVQKHRPLAPADASAPRLYRPECRVGQVQARAKAARERPARASGDGCADGRPQAFGSAVGTDGADHEPGHS